LKILDEYIGEEALVMYSLYENRCMDKYEFKATVILSGFKPDVETDANEAIDERVDEDAFCVVDFLRKSLAV